MITPPANTTAAQTPATEPDRECKLLFAMENKRSARARVPRRFSTGWRASSSDQSDNYGWRRKKNDGEGGVLAVVHERLIQGGKNQPLPFICCLQAFLASAVDMPELSCCCLAIHSFMACLLAMRCCVLGELAEGLELSVAGGDSVALGDEAVAGV